MQLASSYVNRTQIRLSDEVEIDENSVDISSDEVEIDDDAQEQIHGHGAQEMEAIRKEIAESLMRARGTINF